MNTENQEEFYKNFKERLESTTSFPSTYYFKFIIENNENKIQELKLIFKNSNSHFSFKESKNGKYVSVTIKIYVIDAEQVILYYKEAGKIDNIILL